jgi:DNA-binding NarL/FixJ family response regulator
LPLPPDTVGAAIIDSMRCSVLVVDDDPLFRVLARRMLAAMGFSVIGEAENIAEGADAVERLSPDAVLLDVWLPDGRGIDLARELVMLPSRPRVVLTSTDPDAVSADTLRWCGAQGFIPKEDLLGTSLEELFVTT